MSEPRALGESLSRVDAVEKVTGSAHYVADIRLPNMLHMKVLRSTQAHARIVGLKTGRAERVPGVVAVVTGRDGSVLVGSCIFDQPPMAVDRVRHVGEPVAAVVAKSAQAARAALEHVEVTYDPLPVLLDPRQAMADGAPLIHPDLEHYRHAPSFHPRPGSNIFHHYRLRRGSVEEGFRQADRVVEHRFQFPHLSHAQLEPHGAIALWEGEDRLKIWTSAQSPFFVRNSLATAFRLRHAHVRVIAPYLGGGFGGKSDVTIEPLVAWVARRIPEHPVRLVLTREEMFSGTVLGRGCWMSVRTGVMGDGTLVAEQIELIFGAGAYGDYCINIVEGAGHNATGPYHVPHVEVDSYGVYTNTPPVGAYRGYGHPEVHWMVERQMDLIARELKMDPVDLRRRNILRPGMVNAFGQEMDDSCARFGECIDVVVKELKSGLASARKRSSEKLSSEKRSSDDQRSAQVLTGAGLAAFMKSPVMSTNAASGAIIKFAEDGSANVLVGCTEMGQGSFTALSQLAADALKVAPHKVRVRSVIDTDVCPYEWQTVASSTTWKVGNAIARAARDAIRQMKQTAAQLWGVDPDQVEHGFERIFLRDDPETYVTFSQVAAGATEANGQAVGGPVVGRGWYIPQGLTHPDPRTGQGHLAAEWTFGCQGAVVSVDRRTGEVRVRKLVTAIDVGRVVNPQLARGQVVGAMATGLGAALSERLIYSPEGRIRNDSLTDYKVPTLGDVRDTEYVVIFLQTPLAESDFGVRPLAEHGTVAVAPAIGNAIAQATGLELTDLPMTAEGISQRLAEEMVESAQETK
jgi:CO/xanthine dehydrogenase Mo-binding subunit